MSQKVRELTAPIARSWNTQYPATRIGLVVLTLVLAISAVAVMTGHA